MKKLKSSYLRPQFFWLLAVSLVIVTAGLFYINILIQTNLNNATIRTLHEVMEQQAFNFKTTLEAEKKLIQEFADTINVDEWNTQQLRKITQKISDFNYISVADTQGHAISNIETISYDVGNTDFFQASLAGKTHISESYLPQLGADNVIVISAPIERNGQILGVLFGSYSSERLGKLFLPSFEGKGYAYAADENGRVIAETRNEYNLAAKSDNLFGVWSKADFYSGNSYDMLRRRINASESGYSKYTLNGQKRLMCYTSIGINQWVIYSIVPDEIITKWGAIVSRMVLLLSVISFVANMGMLLMMFRMQRTYIRSLSKIAFEDELTAAPTLAKFKIDAQYLIETYPDTSFVLSKIDVDRFRLVNQIFGYEIGDKALKAMAYAAQKAFVGKNDLFARMSEDDFILLHEYFSEDYFHAQIRVFESTFFEHMGDEFKYHLDFQIGCYYLKSENCKKIAEAIEKANIAQRRAKETDIGFCVYNDEMIMEALKIKDIENRMDDALRTGSFVMYLQAKHSLTDNSLVGAEALVRWCENGNIVMRPDEFIPAFERNGFVVKLDWYMFEEACKFISTLNVIGKLPIVVSVNFSRLHLHDEKFVETMCTLADKYSVPRKYLEIEITETAIFDNEEIFHDVLKHVHDAGFTLSMDDFGSGYSSLGLLKNIDFDVIKIDRSFFYNSPDLEKAKLVLANMIKMAKDLHIKTVAEGVELEKDIVMLCELGCDIVQGYYFAKPVPVEIFIQDMDKNFNN